MNREMGSYTHGHGWGAVAEKDGGDAPLRSVRACWDDDGLDLLRGKTVNLLHARMASKGAVTLGNVHPFSASVNDAQWSYCHNGTVRQPLKLPGTLRKSDGTDSEKVFHQVLPYLEQDRVLEGIRAVYGVIDDFTSLNTFLLGPEVLWVVCLYTEMPDYYTLHLSTTKHGPMISSEPLAELDPQPTALFSGQVLCVDRISGDIQEFTL